MSMLRIDPIIATRGVLHTVVLIHRVTAIGEVKTVEVMLGDVERYLDEVFNLRLDDLENGRLGGDRGVTSQSEVRSADPVSHEFIHAQIAKCEAKLGAGDHDGAIVALHAQ